MGEQKTCCQKSIKDLRERVENTAEAAIVDFCVVCGDAITIERPENRRFKV